jgi:hypothetical protein
MSVAKPVLSVENGWVAADIPSGMAMTSLPLSGGALASGICVEVVIWVAKRPAPKKRIPYLPSSPG